MTVKQKREQLTALFGVYSQRIERLYDDFIMQLSHLAHKTHVSVKDMLTESPLFHFNDYPEIRQELNNIFADYVQSEMLAYRTGITDGVALAYTHDNSVLTGFSVLSDKAISHARNTAAETFLRTRLKTTDGLNLSQLVWNYCSQTKSEFEVAISNVIADGLKQGTSAADLGRMVRQYLNNPDMMYRRYHRTVVDAQGNKKDIVRWRRRIIDENGKVRFIEQPLEKVGMGHYRSSRKNSERLMRTEINSAYHHANYERWQKEPFVIGISIELSPQHPVYDECDELQGLYPKDFLFASWHPQCLCTSNPITIQGKEKEEFYRRLAAGEDMSNYVSPNRITDIPDRAKAWIDENKDKFIRAAERGKLGYVWRDNMKYVGRRFTNEELGKMGYTPDILHKKRIKTDAEKAEIQRRWEERKLTNKAVADGKIMLEKLTDFPELDKTTLLDAISKRDRYLINSVLDAMRPKIEYERSITPNILLDSIMRQKYGNDAVEQLYANTKRTIKSKVTGSIDEKIKALRFEADWVIKNRSFATVKEVAAYYEREAVRLEAMRDFDRIIVEIKSIEKNLSKFGVKTVLKGNEWYGDINILQEKLNGLSRYKTKFERINKLEEFAKTSKSTIIHSHVEGIKYALDLYGVDANIEKMLAEAEKKMERLQAEKARRERKAAEKAAEERKKKMEKLYGKTITVDDIKVALGEDCPLSIKDLQKIIDKYENDVINKYTEEEILRFKVGMKQMFAKFDFGMNIEGRWLENCMDECFKNLIEVGHGNGSEDIPNRVNAAKNMFGFGNKDMGRKMEKYGSLLDHDKTIAFNHNGASHYGECVVRFRKDKVIATWTNGDSLCCSYQPSLTTDPKLSSLSRYGKRFIPDDFDKINTVANLRSAINNSCYIELQYHGNLTFDCVESVAFDSLESAQKYSHLIPKMKQLKIEVLYYDKKTGKMVEL